MPREFDPYFEWLKIPPSEQPPNHYRLLDLARFENDLTMIESAVSRLVARLQSLSNGAHVSHAQRMLNDVAKARLCLIDAEKKADYDRRLEHTMEQGGLGAADLNTSATLIDPTTLRPKPKRTTVGIGTRSSTSGNRVSQPSNRSQPGNAKSSAPTTSRGKSKSRKAMNQKSNHNLNSRPNAVAKTAYGLLIGYGVAILIAAVVASVVLVQRISRPNSNAIASTETDAVSLVDRVESSQPDAPQQTQPPRNANLAGAVDDATTHEATVTNDASTISQGVPPGENANVVTDPVVTPVAGPAVVPPPANPNPSSNVPTPMTSTNPLAPTPAPATPTPETPAPVSSPKLTPDQVQSFRDMAGEFVEFEGVPVSAGTSKSKKTRYLRFSQDWNESAMVYMSSSEVGDELTVEVLQQYVGKKIRVRGEIEEEFGTKRIGVKIKARNQIELVE